MNKIQEAFENTCLNSDLGTIKTFVENNSKKITLINELPKETSIIYTLVVENKIDILKFLASTTHVEGFPNLNSFPYYDQDYKSSLQILYDNGHKETIKSFLTNNDLKDNLLLSCKQVVKNKKGLELVFKSYFLEYVIRKEDLEFADFLLNNKSIKYPIERDFNILMEAIHSNINTENFNVFLNQLLSISKDFFSEDNVIKNLYSIFNYGEEYNFTQEVYGTILSELIDLNLINPDLIIEEVKNNPTSELAEIINTSKISNLLLYFKLDKNIINKNVNKVKLKI